MLISGVHIVMRHLHTLQVITPVNLTPYSYYIIDYIPYAILYIPVTAMKTPEDIKMGSSKHHRTTIFPNFP